MSSMQGCTPQQAKERFGATHYSTCSDGVTPQMWYKKEKLRPDSDGVWVYLSFCDLWKGSAINQDPEQASRLVPIDAA